MIRRIYMRLLNTKFATKVVICLILFVFFCIHFGLIAPLLNDKDRPLPDTGILGLFGPKADTQPKYSVNYTSPWTWTCGDNGECQRQLRSSAEGSPTSLDACWLTCGTFRSVWPKPRTGSGETVLGYETRPILAEHISLLRVTSPSDKVKALAEGAFDIFKKNVEKLHPKYFARNYTIQEFVSVSIIIKSAQDSLTLLTDEKYELSIKEKEHGTLSVSISGETFFGVRHGLETLGQLIVFDDFDNSLKILREVKFHDGPAFPYRGLMIDTARNFIPIPALQRMVDGMGQNKMNMLHWHVTDSNSFPLYCPSYPKMTDYGAHSKFEIYHPEEVKEFVHYALLRGVKVIPEIDAPAHAGNGWQWGTKENGFGQLALCVNEEPFNEKCFQPPCGQLNPANPKVYEVLRGIYRDFLSVFDPDLFHMGGDEVKYNCWKTPENQELMVQHNMTENIALRAYFQAKALEALKLASQSVAPKKTPIPIIWTSDLTDALPKLNNSGINATEYIMQLWLEVPAKSPEMKAILDANFPVIASNFNYMYLDLGAGGWMGVKEHGKYVHWQTLYTFDFNINGYNTTKRVFNSKFGEIPQILGAEAPLWSEIVNEDTMDAKLWPRGAALAERLWHNPDPEDIKIPLVHARLLRQNERMKQRGIRVDSRQPKYCVISTGSCENVLDLLPPLPTPVPAPAPPVATTPPPVTPPPATVQFVTTPAAAAAAPPVTSAPTPTQTTPSPKLKTE